jgi:hypothetical protein
MDALLDWLAVLFPTLLSVVGVVVSITAPKSHHRRWWYAGLILLGLTISAVTFLEQSRSRASHVAEISRLAAQLARIERNTKEPPQVHLNVPAPIIYPTTEPERAKLHIRNFELLFLSDNVVAVNVFVQNRGKVSARFHSTWFVQFGPLDKTKEEDLEKKVKAGLESSSEGIKSDIGTATPESVVWFTQEGVHLDDVQMAQFKTGLLQYFFAGVIVYKDKIGEHRTYYCASSYGRPNVFVLCHKNNEEL